MTMPMSREEYENLLNELNNPELEHSKRTEYLQNLRVDYAKVLEDTDNYTKRMQELEKDNQDLLMSNSKLFRQVGIQGDPEMEKKEEQKTLSETITIDQFESRLK